MKQIKIGAVSYARMCAAMIPGDLTCQELAQETGLHYVTVLHYTRELHAAGAAHIVRFDPDVRGRALVKVYKLGPGKDARRTPMTSAQKQARWREKRRATQQLAVTAGRGRYVQVGNGRVRFEAVEVAA